LLFKPVVEKRPKQLLQTVPPGVDPKSILCINFKNGHCINAETCIFSHDLATERKVLKRDAYTDQRDLMEDTMDNWDEKKISRSGGKEGF